MPDLKSSGIYADTRSGGGAFRSAAKTTTNTGGTGFVEPAPGVPMDIISHRDVAVYWTDFFETADATAFTATEIGTADDAAVVAAEPNGVYRASHDTANEGWGSIQQAQSALMTAAAGRIITFEARVSITDVSDGDWYIGIGEVDTTFLSNAGAILANGGDNHIGFHHIVADAGVPTLSSAGVAVANVQSTQLGSGVDHNGSTVSFTLSDATFHKYAIRLVGLDLIEFYIDDKLVHVRTSDDDFAEPMAITFANVANGTEQAMDIDYVFASSTR
jgi:hypothetical protein